MSTTPPPVVARPGECVCVIGINVAGLTRGDADRFNRDYHSALEADMSEQGWREFLAAADVADWVVLHGGPTAVFRLQSTVEAARLAEALAHVPGLEGAGVLITIADTQLTVRLTRDLWQLAERHVQLARAVSAVARARGAIVDRARAQEVSFAIAAQPDAIDVGFWRAALGYAGASEDNAVDPLGHGSVVWMQDLDAAKPLRHAMHVDVSVAREQVEERLAAALAAGGRIVDSTPTHWTLADRAGNRVCICAWPDGFSRPAATGPESSGPEEDRHQT